MARFENAISKHDLGGVLGRSVLCLINGRLGSVCSLSSTDFNTVGINATHRVNVRGTSFCFLCCVWLLPVHAYRCNVLESRRIIEAGEKRVIVIEKSARLRPGLFFRLFCSNPIQTTASLRSLAHDCSVTISTPVFRHPCLVRTLNNKDFVRRRGRNSRNIGPASVKRSRNYARLSAARSYIDAVGSFIAYILWRAGRRCHRCKFFLGYRCISVSCESLSR